MLKAVHTPFHLIGSCFYSHLKGLFQAGRLRLSEVNLPKIRLLVSERKGVMDSATCSNAFCFYLKMKQKDPSLLFQVSANKHHCFIFNVGRQERVVMRRVAVCSCGDLGSTTSLLRLRVLACDEGEVCEGWREGQ